MLPKAFTRLEFDALQGSPDRWLPAAGEICRLHGLDSEDLSAFADGSNLVCHQGTSHVVKTFPPFQRHQWEAECIGLAEVLGRLKVHTPEILARGEYEDWTYLILSFITGEPLSQVWPRLQQDDKIQIMKEIGTLIESVHSLSLSRETLQLQPPWPDFLEAQIRLCESRHKRNQLPEHLLAELPSFLESNRSLLSDHTSPVLLTGEYTPGNILLKRSQGNWFVSGLIDFGDCMIGDRDYDLLGPSTFLCAGDPSLVQSLFQSYGRINPLKPPLRNRLMALLLLHRYSCLKVQLKLPDWEESGSISILAERIWPDLSS